jgi:hypothetical protein
MKNICEYLCPKKRKKPSPYDVHEETFEMDENIAEIEVPEKLSEPSPQMSERSLSHQNQSPLS